MTTRPGGRDRPALAVVHAELSVLLIALWYEIDHGDGSGASDFFTADAELTFSRRTFRGTAEIDGLYRARAARGARVSRHVVSNLHVLRHGTNSSEAVSALVLYAQDGEAPLAGTRPVLVADVHDRFVRPDRRDGEDARWLIASRHIDSQFLSPGDVLAVPTS